MSRIPIKHVTHWIKLSLKHLSGGLGVHGPAGLGRSPSPVAGEQSATTTWRRRRGGGHRHAEMAAAAAAAAVLPLVASDFFFSFFLSDGLSVRLSVWSHVSSFFCARSRFRRRVPDCLWRQISNGGKISNGMR